MYFRQELSGLNFINLQEKEARQRKWSHQVKWPILDMVVGLRGDLKNASNQFGKMAEVMEREAKVQEEAAHEDPMQALQKKSVAN